jgi:pimeloyl-ACP methyl ester carboxylesterase
MGRRGKGFSDDSPEYSYDREYDDITLVVDAVGPSRLLFAQSSGAICALGAALTSSMDKLVIVEPPLPLDEPAIADEHHAAVKAALERGEEEPAVLLALRHALRLEPQVVDDLRARSDWPGLLRGLAWLRELDEINRLPKDIDRYRAIETPTLLIYGGATQPRRRAVVEALSGAIPNAHVIGFSGHGHDVANTAAKDVASAIIDFLNV